MKLLLAIAAAASAATPVMDSLTGVRDSYPRLSPDGKRLVFHSNRLGRQAIWIADGDGSNPRVLFDHEEAGSNPAVPNWSADGRRIAFAMRPAEAPADETEIYVIDANGSNLERLTSSPGGDGHPHWSRSGRIYFSSTRASPPAASAAARQADIYSMAADGTDVKRHTDCRGSCTYSVPSPDERFIVHRRAVDEEGVEWDGSPARNSEIFVTPLDGSQPLNVSKHRAFEGWPALSPDGRWIVFASTRDGGAFHAQIYAVRPNGSGLRQLTRGSWSRIQPSFSPDGKRVLVNEHHESPEFEVSHLTQFETGLPE